MALIYCDECGTQVSDRAPACPKCGNPLTPLHDVSEPIKESIAEVAKPRKSGVKVVGGIFALFILICLFYATGQSADHSSDANQQKEATAYGAPVPTVPSTAAPIPTEPPQTSQPVASPIPTHNYVMEQDGEYGYQPAISDDDAKHGTVTKPLAMYRYRGRVGDIYTVDVVDDDNSNVFSRASCQDPCQFVKIRTIVAGQIVKTETVPNTDGSLINAALEDAVNGQLEVYGSVQKTSANVQTEPNGQATIPVTPAARPTETITASFDCSKTRSASETLICGDPELAAADVELASIYVQAKAAAKDQVAFADGTRLAWNYRERTCHDKACLIHWYAQQKLRLKNIAKYGE